jgi:hypothetical protein
MSNQIITSIICSIFLTTTNHALAETCKKSVTYLKVGEVAPCTGYLFSPEKELQVRTQVEENKLLKEEVKLQSSKVELLKDINSHLDEVSKKQQQKADLWENRAEKATQELIKQQQNRQQRDLLFLTAGVLLTVGSAYVLGQISK